MPMRTPVPTAPVPVLIGFSAATDAPSVEAARVPFAAFLTRLIEENLLLRSRRTIGKAPHVYRMDQRIATFPQRLERAVTMSQPLRRMDYRGILSRYLG